MNYSKQIEAIRDRFIFEGADLRNETHEFRLIHRCQKIHVSDAVTFTTYEFSYPEYNLLKIKQANLAEDMSLTKVYPDGSLSDEQANELVTKMLDAIANDPKMVDTRVFGAKCRKYERMSRDNPDFIYGYTNGLISR